MATTSITKEFVIKDDKVCDKLISILSDDEIFHFIEIVNPYVSHKLEPFDLRGYAEYMSDKNPYDASQDIFDKFYGVKEDTPISI